MVTLQEDKNKRKDRWAGICLWPAAEDPWEELQKKGSKKKPTLQKWQDNNRHVPGLIPG